MKKGSAVIMGSIGIVISISVLACGVIVLPSDHGKNILGGLLFIVIGLILFKLSVSVFKYGAIVSKKYFNSIQYAQIIDAQDKVIAGSQITRAVVGDFVAGPVGAIIGASTAKTNKYTIFLLTRKDGAKSKKKVLTDSVMYNKLLQYVN